MPADPETVLRLACERMMAVDPRSGRPEPAAAIATTGRALTAAGLMSEAEVSAVVDEYTLAMGVRGVPGFRFARHAQWGSRVDLPTRRVVPGTFEIEGKDRRFTLTRIALAEDGSSFEGFGMTAGPGGRSSPRGGYGPRGIRSLDPGTLTVTDDRGTTTTAAPQGWSGSDMSWHATFHAAVPLSPATSWIEVDGTRIDLPPAGVVAPVRIEKLTGGATIADALDREIVNAMLGQDSLEDFVATLVTVGAIQEDDQDVAGTRRVADAIGHGTPAAGLRPPWDAVLRRATASDGPVGEMAIMAIVESVDGYCIRFEYLTSEADSFSVDLTVSPGSPLTPHFPGFRFDPAPITWWAQDDRHNTYLGLPGRGGGSSSSSEGTIHFLSPLDPRATELTLTPTGRSERAVVTVPLDALWARS